MIPTRVAWAIYTLARWLLCVFSVELESGDTPWTIADCPSRVSANHIRRQSSSCTFTWYFHNWSPTPLLIRYDGYDAAGARIRLMEIGIGTPVLLKVRVSGVHLQVATGGIFVWKKGELFIRVCDGDLAELNGYVFILQMGLRAVLVLLLSFSCCISRTCCVFPCGKKKHVEPQQGSILERGKLAESGEWHISSWFSK